jgi:aspartyl/asparaginyl beta-hydroxylase (cupin superfamily)
LYLAMSDSFLRAVAERAAAAASSSTMGSNFADACNAAAAALEEGDAESALHAANAAIIAQPLSADGWALRSKALNELHLFADVLASVPCMSSIDETGESWGVEGLRAQASLQALFQAMPELMARTGSGDLDARQEAWTELMDSDPTSLQGRSAVYGDWVQQAARMREAEIAAARSKSACDNESHLAAQQALACLQETLADAVAYRESESYQPPDASALLEGGACLAKFLHVRRPNVPLSAYGPRGADEAEAMLELNTGLAVEHATEAGTADMGKRLLSRESCAGACAHYARSASLSPTTRIFLLWEAAVLRDASTQPASLASMATEARRAALATVYHQAVRAGIWPSFWQRPQTLISGLTASAWHHARNFDACRKLEENFGMIQKEALEILRQDASGGARFASHDSKALAAGDWCDVGLYFNGMRNDGNAVRAPKTSALLCGDVGGLRQDCTSCPLGSAYFSLLRPHTWIAAHCGPTNARLRAHLSLIVPEGDCEIIVGGEARKWVEGEVLLFDDSFEHEVHNATDLPRLVLIVDLWHPDLKTDEQRAAALHDDEQRRRYLAAKHNGYFETTVLRGH